MSQVIEELESFLGEEHSEEDRIELRRVIRELEACYDLGERVKVQGIEEPLTVAGRAIYGPSAQWYGVVHHDPTWQPPSGFPVNTNFKPTRVIVRPEQIKGRTE